jgi:hypothetical protein
MVRKAAGANSDAGCPPVSAGSVARAMFVQWVIMTVILATFFYFVTPRSTAQDGVSRPIDRISGNHLQDRTAHSVHLES